MPKTTTQLRTSTLLALAFLVSACAQNTLTHSNPSVTDVQSSEQIQEPDQGQSRAAEAKTEHTRIEDGSAQIDEVRVRGQTQSIQVKPQNNMPGYEVTPHDPAHPNNQAAGRASWRILSF